LLEEKIKEKKLKTHEIGVQRHPRSQEDRKASRLKKKKES
jgi:hypothetical protein